MIDPVAKQGKMLKIFKELEISCITIGCSKLAIYFKINLYKFATKYPIRKKSTQSCHFLKNDLKSIKAVCKDKANVLRFEDL